MGKEQLSKESQSLLELRGEQGRYREGFFSGKEVCVMQSANVYLSLLHERGRKGLPVERVYRQLYNPELYLLAYGKIYRNKGAMTKGVTGETPDGMALEKIDTIIEALRYERYRWQPARRVYIPRKDGKQRPLGMPIGLSYCLSFPAMFGISMTASAGGPEAPAHPSGITLPRSVATFQPDEGSNVVGLACEAPRCVLE